MDSRVRDFNMKTDYPDLLKWMTRWKMPAIPPSMLSDTGVVVPGIACGFLYLTNSSLGMIDVFVSNPDSDKLERAEALDAVIRRLLWMAKDYDCKVIKASTKLQAVRVRAKKFGFSETGEYTSVVKGVANG